MSAEIIPFGKPRSAPVKRRRKVRKAGEETTIGDLIAEFGRAPTASEIREVLDRRRPAERDSETVRLMFGDVPYEVAFCGNDVQCVDAIQYRIAFDGSVHEMKRRHWSHFRQRHALDPALVGAAQRVRASGRKDDEMPFREAALAAFRKRRAKLISEVEKIDETIASMRCN
jgi:hypothetical protein